MYSTCKVWLKCATLPPLVVVLPMDLGVGRVFVLCFIGEEVDVLSITSFKHHIPQPYFFNIK